MLLITSTLLYHCSLLLINLCSSFLLINAAATLFTNTSASTLPSYWNNSALDYKLGLIFCLCSSFVLSTSCTLLSRQLNLNLIPSLNYVFLQTHSDVFQAWLCIQACIVDKFRLSQPLSTTCHILITAVQDGTCQHVFCWEYIPYCCIIKSLGCLLMYIVVHTPPLLCTSLSSSYC